MAKLKLDLHDIYNKGLAIDKELNRIVNEAVSKRIALVEIIPGKGSGQLKKKVLRFLEQKHIKNLYHRIEKDSKNFGRIFIPHDKTPAFKPGMEAVAGFRSARSNMRETAGFSPRSFIHFKY